MVVRLGVGRGNLLGREGASAHAIHSLGHPPAFRPLGPHLGAAGQELLPRGEVLSADDLPRQYHVTQEGVVRAWGRQEPGWGGPRGPAPQDPHTLSSTTAPTASSLREKAMQRQSSWGACPPWGFRTRPRRQRRKQRGKEAKARMRGLRKKDRMQRSHRWPAPGV